MFKRKKEKSKQVNVRLEDEFSVSSSDIAKALHKDDHKKIEEPLPGVEESSKTPPVFDEDEIAEEQIKEVILNTHTMREFIPKTEPSKEVDIPKEPIDEIDSQEDPIKDVIPQQESLEPPKDIYIWANTEEYEEKMAKQKGKKRKKGKKEKEITPKIQPQKTPEKPIVVEEEKVDLNSFFEASNASNKLKRRDRKKYSKKELKRRKRRSKQKRTSEDLKDQNKYKFRKKKYAKVEDFINYLNDHYLDIDDVAKDVLADENFFGWISKRSGMFDQSLHEFQEIKAKIEKK